jgi:hypothetical protein
MAERGLIERGSNGRHTKTVNIPGVGKTRVYLVSSRLLQEDES